MKLWIRADASRPTGLGHVMRMIAVAEEASLRGWQTAFVTFDPEQISGPMLKKHGVKPIELSTSDDRTWSARVGADDLVVFDGYTFGKEDHDAVHHAACVASMDDFGRGDFDVDLIVMPEPAERTEYRTPPTTHVKLGPRYAPIRREFLEKRRQRETNGGTLLISAGGTDAAGIVDGILEVATSSDDFKRLLVLVGPGAMRPTTTDPSVALVEDPISVAEVFDQADAAVCAAGSSSWELICLGIPSALIEVTDNQALIASGAARYGAALSLGTPAQALAHLPRALALLADPEIRIGMSSRAMALVDGGGARRILDAMTNIARETN